MHNAMVQRAMIAAKPGVAMLIWKPRRFRKELCIVTLQKSATKEQKQAIKKAVEALGCVAKFVK